MTGFRLVATMGALGVVVWLSAACHDAVDVELLLEGAGVIDLEAGRVVSGVSIGIRGDRIVHVGRPGSMRTTASTVVVDARGKYVLPGFWDMHVHVLHPGVREIAFPLLVANGVTSVRDMNGPLPLAEIEVLRQHIASGEVVGPRIYAPGPLVDGPGRPPSALGDEVLAVATEEEARAAVRRLHGEGADFIKVYNRLNQDLLLAILDEAAALDLPVAGHVPATVAAAVASEAGLRSLEHLQGLLESSSSAGDRLRERTAMGLALMLQKQRPSAQLVAEIRALRVAIVDEYEPARARTLFERLRDNGTWVTPTLVSNRGLLIAPAESRVADDPRLEYLPERWTASWFGNAPAAAAATGRRQFERLVEVVGTLHEVGVPLLVGTDLGVPHVFPGFSLHDELALLVRAGLDETAALRTATSAPPRFLGLDDSGAIASGQRADLVVLDANPLQAIDATRRINAVVLAGRLFRRDDLDTLLELARSRAAEAGDRSQ